MNVLNLLASKSINDIIFHFKTKRDHKKAILEGERIISSYLKNNEVKKLQIGCGPFPIDGWLNTDLLNNEKVAYMDAGKAYPLPDESFDYIFSEHLFEHLTFEQEMIMLKECYRVLKKGGKIRIATPNLNFLLNLKYKNGEIENMYIKHAINTQWNLMPVKKTFNENEYSEVFVINNFFKDWGHQVIHNFESIQLMLNKAGFREVKQKEVGMSAEPAFCKLEQHGNRISNDFNLLETMVVEAEK